nr:protein kinase [Micromonospora sp. DSM 115978]
MGRGGMGVVWRAHDELLDVEVAVKQLRPQPGLTDEQRGWWVQLARREARAAARLRGHPNVVTVHDSVVDDGEPWIVMDYVVGTTLHGHVVERGPLPAAAAA